MQYQIDLLRTSSKCKKTDGCIDQRQCQPSISCLQYERRCRQFLEMPKPSAGVSVCLSNRGQAIYVSNWTMLGLRSAIYHQAPPLRAGNTRMPECCIIINQLHAGRSEPNIRSEISAFTRKEVYNNSSK